MIDAAGARVRPAAGDALGQHVVVDVEDHRDGIEPFAREHGVEGVGLRNRAREPIDDDVVGVRQFGFDHADHEIVRHEFAGIHVALRFQAEGGLVRPMLAQHIARRDLAIPETVLENLRLRALTGTGRPQEHEDHFLMNPR